MELVGRTLRQYQIVVGGSESHSGYANADAVAISPTGSRRPWR